MSPRRNLKTGKMAQEEAVELEQSGYQFKKYRTLAKIVQ
jgi:hypothetical protein